MSRKPGQPWNSIPRAPGSEGDRCPGVTSARFYIPRNPEGSMWSLPRPLTRAPGSACYN